FLGGDSLIGEPKAFRRQAALPEDIDWNPAARIPITSNSQPSRRGFGEKSLPNPDRHILVKARVVAECAKKKLQALGFDYCLFWRIVDHEMSKIRLSSHRAQGSEFGRSEANEV